MSTEEYTQNLQRYLGLCQIFGLAPLTKDHFSSNFYISKAKFAISGLFLLLQGAHAIYQIFKIHDEIHMTTMSAVIDCIWIFQCLLTNILVATQTQSLMALHHLVEYFNQLCNIDEKIHCLLQILPNYKRRNGKHFRISTFVITTSFILSWTLYGFLAIFHPEHLKLFVFIFLPTAFMSVRVFQIVHLIELLNDHLDVINSRLMSISDGEKNRSFAISSELKSLRQLYSQCWNSMQRYNGYLGFSNLMLLLFYSYDVLHGIYCLFLNLYGLRPDLVALYGVCSLPSAISLFVITYAAVRCRNKANDTGVILGKILGLPSCHVHLKRFSVQVIHQQFLMSACGFFIVNFRFLCGMVVGFSNLLLLFIQYEISEKNAL